MWRRIESWVHLHEAVLLILIFTVILRIPSLFEPYWYGDEGIYLTIGQAINKGERLYQDIHDNKPPLLYVMAAVAGGYEFWFKFITLIWMVGVVYLFWKLSAEFFENKKPVVAATLVFAILTSVPFIEGNIANAELYFLAATVGATYLILKKKPAFVAGMILGISGLFKIPALLEIMAWPVVWFFEGKWFRKSLTLGMGAAVIMGLSMVYFASQGTLSRYLAASGFQNISYVSSWTAPAGIVGTLGGRFLVMVVILGLVELFRKQLGKRGVIILVWGVVGLFAALLSGRPYPHYLLQITPVASLAIATLIWGKWSERIASVGLGIFIVVAFLKFNFYTYPVTSYYTNFASYVTGAKSRDEYFRWFGQDVTLDYKIAEIVVLGTTPNERIFVWGDRPVIYALSRRLPVGRYTTKYHILDFKAEKETEELLSQGLAKYIVVTDEKSKLVGLSELLTDNYIKVWENGGYQVYRLWKKF